MPHKLAYVSIRDIFITGERSKASLTLPHERDTKCLRVGRAELAKLMSDIDLLTFSLVEHTGQECCERHCKNYTYTS